MFRVYELARVCACVIVHGTRATERERQRGSERDTERGGGQTDRQTDSESMCAGARATEREREREKLCGPDRNNCKRVYYVVLSFS